MEESTEARVHSPATKFRFGIFEADLRAGELRKSGIKIRLQGLPFKLLSILLENAGEVVTREELQPRIWGTSTVVDFDHSLGTAINKIRAALGDSAENPRYIETLERRGYRFIAPVQAIAPASSAAAVLAPPTEASLELFEAALHEAPSSRTLQIESAGALPRRSRLWTLASILIVVILVPLLWFLFSRNSSLPQQLMRTTQITWSDHIYPGDIGLESFPSLATDGTRIYFPEIRGGRVVLVQSAPTDGETYPLLTPPEVVRPSLADVSLDGSKFLIQSHQWSRVEEPLWVVPSAGGAASMVRGGLAHDAVWTPGGQSVLYASGHDLFLTSNDGREPRKLATVSGRAFWLRYSPDGHFIRFTIVDPTTRATSLWELSADGKNLHPLLPGWSRSSAECCGSWTADGKNFVFQSTRNGQSSIWALDETKFSLWPGSRQPIQVTAGPLNYFAPQPARSGNRIFVIGAHSRSHLSRYDSASHQLVPYLPGLTAAARTEISRDGSRVAWISVIDGSLWQSKLDGSQRLQLTSPPMQIYMMRWSPDGKSVAFMGKEPGNTWKIYMVSSEGGNPRMLLDESRNEADPGWIPDGKSMIFGRSPEYMAEESGTKAIYLLNLQTKAVSTVPGSEGLFSPRLSPDGRYIAAMPLDQRKLMIFDFSTRHWSELADKSVDNPVWSSDGKSIYFHAFMEEGQPIYRIQLADHHLEQVVDFHDLQPAEALDYLGVTSQNDPIVSVHLWTANVYALDW